MTQFQVLKTDLSNHRMVAEANASPLRDGDIRVAVERFGLSANNITYGVAGDTLGYWQFFPSAQNENNQWGIIPVWGFAEVIESTRSDLPVGERLFGYFPPASQWVMTPDDVTDSHFFDASSHRADLPRGYNLYRRVNHDPGYDRKNDDLHMLLFPLYLTSFSLWDDLKDNGWYGADSVLITSASSKTAIGLAYALADDPDAPKRVGLTSQKNAIFVEALGIYDEVITYDDLSGLEQGPTAIVDMAGNAPVLGKIHQHLGDNLMISLGVGLTHWETSRSDQGVNRDKSRFFFAPKRIQQRMKDWGPAEFTKRSSSFIMSASRRSVKWLILETINGLDAMAPVYEELQQGSMGPERGIVVKLR